LCFLLLSLCLLPGGIGPHAQTSTAASAVPPHAPPLPEWEAAAGGKQEFDVASVRQNKSGPPWQGGDPQFANIPYGPDDAFRKTGGDFSATNYPLLNLIVFAYKVPTPQGEVLAASLPSWAMTDGFNIEARTDNHEVTKDQMRLMMRALLVERFHLVVHTEARQVPLYAVVLVKPGKLGPGLRPHPADEPCSTIARPLGKPAADAPPPPPDTVPGGFPTICGSFANMKTTAPMHKREGSRNIPMAAVVSTFTNLGSLGRPAIDRTGLTGNYDWVMEYMLEPPPGVEAPPEAQGPTFIEALRDQLGLKLVQQKGYYDYLVVDHVEHPTDTL